MDTPNDGLTDENKGIEASKQAVSKNGNDQDKEKQEMPTDKEIASVNDKQNTDIETTQEDAKDKVSTADDNKAPQTPQKQEEDGIRQEQEESNRQKKAPISNVSPKDDLGDDFDPMKAFEQASFKFGGLPPLKTNTKTEDEQSPQEEKRLDYSEKESDYSSEDAPTSPKPQEPRLSTTKRIKKNSASVFVKQGDKAQAMLTQMLFNWRGSNGVDAATKDRDKLIKKVTEGKELSKQERLVLAYAQKYITEFDERKKGFEQQSYLSEADKDDLCDLLEDYFEVMGYQPSPLFMILLIIGGTLCFNIYTAFTAHPSYNPPTTV